MPRPREVAGMIIKADDVEVFVDWGHGDDDYTWLPVSKNTARIIVNEAREQGAEDIAAHWDSDEPGLLRIGWPESEEPEGEPSKAS